jgi:hypothetical protein
MKIGIRILGVDLTLINTDDASDTLQGEQPELLPLPMPREEVEWRRNGYTSEDEVIYPNRWHLE